MIDVLDDGRSRSFGWAASGIAAVTAVHEHDRWVDMDTSNCHPETKRFCTACTFLRSEHHRVWSNRADHGVHLHHLFESWSRNEDAEVDEASGPYMDALEKFYVEHSPEFIFSEATIAYGLERKDQRSHRFRGTFDAIAWLSVDRERERWLLDYKSTSGIYPVSMCLQLSAYRHSQSLTDWSDGTERVVGKVPRVDRAGVVWLREDGTFRLVELPADQTAFSHFLRLVDCWHYQRRMDAWTRAHAPEWEEER
ncbi:MAG: hypothetical protein J2P57_04895 [Acidimicrobiaceae bacterium]|nr:hypothetical protein [Acidimicrobiaceae bacterium]